LDFMAFVATGILIPIGGLFAVILIGWKWGVPNALSQLKEGAAEVFKKQPWLGHYFWFCFKFSAPILIILVFLNEILTIFRGG
jgi:NSS family neurotransmitter:Na+ symporter